MSSVAEDGSTTAAQLIDGLIAEGTPVDEGAFRIDAAAAATKLDAFRYADRSKYLVAIAEGARILAARAVHVVTRGEDLLVSLRGVQLDEPLAFLREPFTAQAGDDPQRLALARLGVGIHMALGHAGIRRVAIAYSTDSRMLVSEHFAGGTSRTVQSRAQDPGELRILFDRGWIDQFGNRTVELRHLREAVEFSQMHVELDHELISRNVRRWSDEKRGDGPGYGFVAGLTTAHRPAIELCVEDVTVESLPAPGRRFGALVVLHAPRRDLSQMKIIHDEAVRSALDAIEAHYHTLAERDRLEERQQPDPVEWDANTTSPGARLEQAGFLGTFYAGGIVAGAIAIKLSRSPPLMGPLGPWLASLFSVVMICVSATALAWRLADTRRKRRRLAIALVVFGAGLAVVLGVLFGWD